MYPEISANYIFSPLITDEETKKKKLLWPHKGLVSGFCALALHWQTKDTLGKKNIENFSKWGMMNWSGHDSGGRPSVSLSKTKRQNSILNISVGNCLCNKFSFFLKGTLLQMKHGSVPLVVDNRHDCSRLAQWALRTKDLLPLLIKW